MRWRKAARLKLQGQCLMRSIAPAALTMSLLVACARSDPSLAPDAYASTPQATPTIMAATQPATSSSIWPVTAKEWAVGLQAAFTVLVVLAAGLLGWLRFGWFRIAKPQATLDHHISHRPITGGNVHLAVQVTIHNSSRVVLEFRKAMAWIQRVAPATEAEVEEYQREVLEGQPQDLAWKRVALRYRIWQADQLVVEPGERDQITWEFLIPNELQTVRIYTYFYNERVAEDKPAAQRPERKRAWNWLFFKRKKGPLGWIRVSIHDLNISGQGG